MLLFSVKLLRLICSFHIQNLLSSDYIDKNTLKRQVFKTVEVHADSKNPHYTHKLYLIRGAMSSSFRKFIKKNPIFIYFNNSHSTCRHIFLSFCQLRKNVRDDCFNNVNSRKTSFFVDNLENYVDIRI